MRYVVLLTFFFCCFQSQAQLRYPILPYSLFQQLSTMDVPPFVVPDDVLDSRLIMPEHFAFAKKPWYKRYPQHRVPDAYTIEAHCTVQRFYNKNRQPVQDTNIVCTMSNIASSHRKQVFHVDSILSGYYKVTLRCTLNLQGREDSIPDRLVHMTKHRWMYLGIEKNQLAQKYNRPIRIPKWNTMERHFAIKIIPNPLTPLSHSLHTLSPYGGCSVYPDQALLSIQIKDSSLSVEALKQKIDAQYNVYYPNIKTTTTGSNAHCDLLVSISSLDSITRQQFWETIESDSRLFVTAYSIMFGDTRQRESDFECVYYPIAFSRQAFIEYFPTNNFNQLKRTLNKAGFVDIKQQSTPYQLSATYMGSFNFDKVNPTLERLFKNLDIVYINLTGNL